MAAMETGAADVFISYRWSDEPAETVLLQDMLRKHLGDSRVFFDNRSMDFGDLFPDRLDAALAQCRLLLAVIGPKWLPLLQSRPAGQMDYVAHEIATALARGIPVWPLLVSGATMPPVDQLSDSIKRLASCLSITIRHPFRTDDYRSLREGVDRLLYGATGEEVLILPQADTNLLRYDPEGTYLPRPALMAKLKDALERSDSSHKVALAGMPGGGKTELARAYARAAQGRYRTLLWLTGAPDTVRAPAARKAFLLAQLETIAQDLGLSAETKELTTLFAQIRTALDARGPWLALLDNAGSEHKEWIAQTFGRGTLLLTTRDRGLSQVIYLTVDDEALTPDEGAQLLLTCAEHLFLGQSLADAVPEEREAARQISAEMDNLPLALTLIGGYAKLAQASLIEVRDDYRRSKADYLKFEDGTGNPFWKTSVYDTLARALEQVGDPAAASLLRTCAFLSPDAIPEQLYTGHPDVWPDPLGSAAAQSMRWRTQVLGPCLSLSMLHRTQRGDPAFSVHRLVQEVTRQMLTPEESRTIVGQIAGAVHAQLAGLEMPGDIVTLDRLRPQAMTAVTLCHAHHVALPQSSDDGYSLRTFAEDLKVQEDLRDGSSWEALFGSKNVDYTTLYQALHLLEDTKTRRKIQRVIASLCRVCRTDREAQTALCCLFFVTHFWWDVYLAGDDFCRHLLAMWRGQVHAPENDPFVQALDQFQEHYPVERDWQHLDKVPDAWVQVAEAITALRQLLALETEPADTPARRYVKAITNLYQAKTRVYRVPFDAVDLPSLIALYTEAQALLSENGDRFHLNWGLFEWASGLWRVHRGPEVAALCIQALDGVLQESASLSDADFEFDTELAANCYRLLGEFQANSAETHGQAWPYYCASVMAAATFLLTDQDSYALAFYGEITERFQSWWAGLPADEIVHLTPQVALYWNLGDGALFPPVLNIADITEDAKSGQVSPVLEQIRSRLRALPALHESLLSQSGYTDPPRWELVLGALVKLAA